MWTLRHLKIKTHNNKISLFKERQNICLFDFLHQSNPNIVWKKFHKWNWVWGHKCKIKVNIFQTLQRQMAFHYQKCKILQKNIYAPHKMWSLFESLFENLVGKKKLNMKKHIYSFPSNIYLFTFPLIKLLISSSIFSKIIKCLRIHVIPLVS